MNNSQAGCDLGDGDRPGVLAGGLPGPMCPGPHAPRSRKGPAALVPPRKPLTWRSP